MSSEQRYKFARKNSDSVGGHYSVKDKPAPSFRIMRLKKMMIWLLSFILTLTVFYRIKGYSSLEDSKPSGIFIQAIEKNLAVEDISENQIKIKELNDSYIKETNELQNHFSHLLFWEKDTFEDRKAHAAAVSHSHIVQRNYALLENMTKEGTEAPEWNTFLEFSLSSTAFTQNYYLETFKPDLSPHIQFISSRKTEIENYEKILFPWLKTSIKTLYESFNGKGIIITTGNYHFQFAFLLVKSLRTVLKTELPIEIVYADERDLDKKKRDLISQFNDVTCVDLSEKLIASKLNGVGGWWWKVYSILLSSFSEVIFMDADVLFMVLPESLFNHTNYLKYGQLIYKDRQIKLGMDYNRFRNAHPFASTIIRNSAIWNETTSHEAESGVLVYNKAVFSAFFALLNTCNLNRNPIQNKLVSKYYHGDKETFWSGFELLNLPYDFVKYHGATVGYMKKPNSICGSLAHSDESGKLIWFNGGLAVDKGKFADEIYDFQYYTVDDRWDMRGEWKWPKNDLSRLCWESASPETQVKKLSDNEKELLGDFIKIYKEVRKGNFEA